jgi:regulatory protein
LSSEEARELAAKLLSRRDLSRRELRRRLEGSGVDDPLAEEIVDDFESWRFVDDRRLAAAVAGSLARKGYGDLAIAARLEERGLSAEDRDGAIAELEPEVGRAATVAFTGRKDARALAGFLHRRGFTEEAIESALASFDVSGRES